MKVVLFGAAGMLGRSAADELRGGLTGADALVLVARSTAVRDNQSANTSGPRVTVETAELPLSAAPRWMIDADVVLNCAGPSYRFTTALATLCSAHGIAYVDAGGDGEDLTRLGPVAANSPVLLGAGVQPGLIGALVGRVASPGAEVTVMCGGRQPLSPAALAEYAESVASSTGHPGRCWRDGTISTDGGTPPVPPTGTATVHLHLDTECEDLAATHGLRTLRQYNIIDSPMVALELGRMLSGEATVDDVLAAAAQDEAERVVAPYFVLSAFARGGDGANRRARVVVEDSYRLSGRIAARTALAAPDEDPGARWASMSPAARTWDKVLDVEVDQTDVVVVGATFGRVYARGIAACPDLRLAGIGGAGGERSAALAETFETGYFTGPVSGVDAAVVAVRSALVGGLGDDIVTDLLASKVSVLQEHPVDVRAIGEHLRTAAEHGVHYAPTGFYEHLPTSRTWIGAVRALRAADRVEHLSARTSIQVLERALLIIGAALGAAPTGIPEIRDVGPRAFQITTRWGGIPVDLLVHNRIDPDAPDDHSHPLLSVAVTAADGELLWPHVHASAQWVGPFDDAGQASLSEPVGEVGDTLDDLWSAAVTASVHAVMTASPQPGVSQRHLATIHWWQRVCAIAPVPAPASADHRPGASRAALGAVS